jgi:hypothetical protein
MFVVHGDTADGGIAESRAQTFEQALGRILGIAEIAE